MNLELCGYFDHNFGDDYMQKITAHYMSEYEIYIDPDDGKNVSVMLLKEPNVSIKSKDPRKKFKKLLVTGSGFMVNSFPSLKCELVWFLKAKHIADFCIGCNIEPFSSKLAEWLVAQKLKKFKYILCRDTKSLAWVKKRCPATAAEYIPDILFAMPKAWLPSKPLGDKLGISLIRFEGDNGAYYRKMAKIADDWIESTGTGVILLAFDVGLENDTSVCEKTKRMIRHKAMVKIVTHGAEGEIPNAFSECRKIIGARFHSAVLSMKMGIDFYPIIYRQKMQNLIADTMYPIQGSHITVVDAEDINRFLKTEKIDFKLDACYEAKIKNGFKALKSKLKKA